MHRTLGELPDQPGLHRSEQQLALLCKLSRTLNIIENPLDLRRGKIRVNDQSRLLTVCLLETLRLQCIRNVRSSAALPHDRIIDRFSSLLVPDNRRLTLIGDTDRRNIRRRRADHVHRLNRHAKHCRPDLIGIVLHPARIRKKLPELFLCHRTDLSLLVK